MLKFHSDDVSEEVSEGVVFGYDLDLTPEEDEMDGRFAFWRAFLVHACTFGNTMCFMRALATILRALMHWEPAALLLLAQETPCRAPNLARALLAAY